MQKAHRRPRISGPKLSVIGIIIVTAGIRPVLGAPWEFGTIVDLGVLYTDNLRLESEGLEESEFVYTIAPTFSLSTESDRLTADLRYRPEAYFFDTAPESDSVFHVLDASVTGALIRDALFVAASATNFQSIVTPDGRIPTSNLPISGNRLDSMVLEVRPYWQQNLGFADILAEVAYTATRYDELESTQDTFLQNNSEWRGRFDLNNHSRQQGFAWGMDYLYRRTEYDESIPFDYQRASANLGYWINGTLRVFASGGVESAFDNFFESNLDDEFWEAGFQYSPNQRLDLEIAVGERGYGESYRANMTYELRRGQTALTYTEQPSTRGDSAANRRPITDTDNLDDFLNRPGRSDRFIRKRGEWMTTIELAKSDISLRLFFEERTQRTSATGEVLQDEENSGGAFRWNWRFGAKSTLGFLADYSRRQTSVRDGTLTRLSIDYSYQISERLSIVALAQRSDDDSRNSDDDYVENQYRLTLRAEF